MLAPGGSEGTKPLREQDAVSKVNLYHILNIPIAMRYSALHSQS